jgi:hypothetical protein
MSQTGTGKKKKTIQYQWNIAVNFKSAVFVYGLLNDADSE